MRWLRALRVASSFLTRLPVGGGEVGEAELADSTAWYPLVGLLVGGLLGLAGWALSLLLPAPVAAGLVLVLGLLLTGALHEDGLGDTADGLGGGWTPERALEIMRDSRIGAYGSVTVSTALILRFSLLSAIEPELWLVALPVAHGLGRWTSVALLLGLPYARSEGKAGPMIRGIGPVHGALASLTVVAGLAAVALLQGPLLAAGLAGATLVLAGLAGLWFRRKVGGVTGDLLGAVVVVAELLNLVVWTGAQG